MLNEIKKSLLQIVNDIDVGNSQIDEEDEIKVINTLREFTRKDKMLSKYQAYTYLNMSRATFDNKVKSGDIPKGIKVPGFKELMWKESDLRLLIKNNYGKNK